MIRNKYLIKLYVKAHYIWYYITHPKMWWKRMQLGDSNLKKVLDLYIGNLTKKRKQVMDVVLAIGCMIGGLFGIMLSFYLLLVFIQWISDVIDEKRWQDWRYWIK